MNLSMTCRTQLLSRFFTATLLVFAGAADAAAEIPVDPLNSPSWGTVHGRYFKGQTVVFDDRVQVSTPAAAENPMDVPVQVRAEGLTGVQEILVLADLNPIQRIVSYEPTKAEPSLAFRFKVEQSTPVRAAMRTADGIWHVGGVWLSASGGGCTTPSVTSASPAWQTQLNQVNGRLWPTSDKSGQRLRLRIVHPMDTGLASGIPPFYIDRIVVSDAAGQQLARVSTYEPISENPVLSLDLRNSGPVQISGGDIQGNQFSAELKP